MTPITSIITLDVHDHPNLKNVLMTSAELLAGMERRGTYFVPSGLIQTNSELAAVLRQIRRMGHTIGCHGLNHSLEEDFRSISPERELAILRQATQILEDALGERIISFRAPVFRLSNYTLPFLAELGYLADLSVTPQRLSFLSSTPWSFAGFFAPRSPYRPHRLSPYRRGDLPILEIPTTTLFLPLAHGAMSVLRAKGLPLMIRAVFWEAARFGRPVVASIHPESIAGEDWYFENRPLKLSDFIPRTYGGLNLRYHFADIKPDQSKQLAIQVAQRVSTGPEVHSMTIDEYLEAQSFQGNESASTSGLPQLTEAEPDAPQV
jgi:Polysaccharide deacetylase